MRKSAAGLLIALLAVSSCFAQTDQESSEGSSAASPEMSKLLEQLAAAREVADQEPTSLAPAVACAEIADEAAQTRCWQAFEAYFDYYRSGFEHRRRVFAWQHLSTQIIFVVVLILVGAGLFFAWLQFRRDSTKPSGGEKEQAHEVEIGPGGVKVSSPVLGVVILTLSLAFFYLYLIYVYPIREIL